MQDEEGSIAVGGMQKSHCFEIRVELGEIVTIDCRHTNRKRYLKAFFEDIFHRNLILVRLFLTLENTGSATVIVH
ncbi:hypothetical protein CEXT_716941 [Caerostris extrusa]|uniref:Uncharacterized protein n=1 Tax=Caerostris extrusa TaxID=172846 RepID=A0AAV4TRF1_CAEEX|nr:hypothetical protein CEXT_716941 [Caerostris extrusa]